MKTRIVLALALILVIASSAAVAAVGATVPFRVALQTFPVETGFDPVTGILTMDIPGEGQATHLGNSTFESVSYVYLYSPYPYRQVTDAALIAANGDRLNFAFEGTVVPGEFEGELNSLQAGVPGAPGLPIAVLPVAAGMVAAALYAWRRKA